MRRYREVFPKKHTLLIAIHTESLSQTLRNVGIAKEAGADGVFLINHGSLSGEELLDVYRGVRAVHPDWWIGINALDLGFSDSLSLIPSDVSGLWEDASGINEDVYDTARVTRNRWRQRQEREDWQGLYFGSVAFKYQKKVRNPGRAAGLSMIYMDIVTTSGEATGSPADIAKIATMRRALGRSPLAVASGIAPENVDQYLGLVDCFIVATGVSRSFTELDPARVSMLVKAIQSA